MVRFDRAVAAVLLLITLGFSALTAQQIRSVATSQEIRMAVLSAQPGDEIVVNDGVYDLGETLIITRSGKEGLPITIRAKNRGKAELTGSSHITVKSASYVVIEGFLFTMTNGPAVLLEGSNNIRVSRNIFRLKETKQSQWLHITGNPKEPLRRSHHNVIERNLFEKKSQLGNYITLEGSKKPELLISQYDTIARNHFRDIGPRVENVLEAIRIGSSEFTFARSHTIIEQNLFERCDGDPEVVSVKSCDNVIRHNTFFECFGVLSLRHGNRNTIDGNFFLGNGRTGTFLDSTGRTWQLGTGGVRFYGDSMTIVNNYFEGLTGRKWDGTIAMTSGNAEYGQGLPLTKHYRSRWTLVAFNTLINNASHLEIGYDGEGFQGNWWHLPPSDITIANNLIVGSTDTLINLYTEPINAKWEGNILHATDDAIGMSRPVRTGVAMKYVALEKRDGFWRPAAGSVPVDGAEGEYRTIVADIEGQPRVAKKDVGADEQSTAPVRNRPLTASDVGPDSK
ncbi:MAG: lyase [Ignavibacteria bacterium]|nr:lyase [Ignavibacteria bacterium]